jgi:predicted acyltransferase
MPMNKNLWSVSYLFFTAGLALHFLAMCFWLIDLKGIRSIAVPFVIFGCNAIFVYVLSSAAAKLLYVIKFQSSAHSISLKTWLFQNLFKSWAGEMNGSLIFAITYVLIWLGVTYLLYRKKIFIKI